MPNQAKALALADDLIGADPDNSRYLSQHARALHVRAMALQDLGERKLAEADYVKAIGLLDGLSKRFPTVREHPTAAAMSRHNLAILIEDDGRLDESDEIHRAQSEILGRVGQQRTVQPEFSIQGGTDSREPGGSARKDRPQIRGRAGDPPGCSPAVGTDQRFPQYALVFQ